MAGVREHWRTSRLSSILYDAAVERERLSQPLGRLVWGTDTRLLYRDIERLGHEPEGSSVLDVPCGGGVALRGLRPGQRVRYVGVDLSPVMLERSRAEAQRRGLSMIELMEADVESLVFEDASFDTCVSYNGLHCFADPQAAIAEIARILRPGGEFRGSAAVHGTGARQDAVIRAYRRAGIFGRCPTANELRSWLEGAGLAGVDVNTSGVVAYYRARRAAPG